MNARKVKTRKGPYVPGETADRQTTQDVIAQGQAGDLQGLSNVEEADSESISELIAEGQPFEAGIIEGIQNAPDPDVAEVKTKEFPEDDVPTEYLEDN
jgi:hypothetical protein